MIWFFIFAVLVVVTPIWEWRRAKMSLEMEVAVLRWTVLMMGLAFLLFGAQAQVRLERLSSQAKSNHAQPATPQLQRTP
jgi:hypothetical protein